MWVRWLAAAGVKADQLKPALSFNYSSLMIQAAIDGLGVALAQEALVRDDLATGRLIRPFEVDMPSDYAYYVVSPEATAERPKVAAFRTWLLTEACTEPEAEAAGRSSPALADGAAPKANRAARP
jgi:LysR family glycine cleavage system transcriptional activator